MMLMDDTLILVEDVLCCISENQVRAKEVQKLGLIDGRLMVIGAVVYAS